MRPQKSYIVSTDELQGEKSFIALKRLTYGERNEAIRKIKEFEGKDLLDFYLSAINEFVIDWNWQDEQGEPIPVAELDKLMPEEVSFLVASVGKLLRGELLLDTKN